MKSYFETFFDRGLPNLFSFQETDFWGEFIFDQFDKINKIDHA